MALFSVLAALQVLVLITAPFFKDASGPGSDESSTLLVTCTEDVEGQLAKAAEAEIDARTRQSCPEVNEGGVVAEESERGGAADKIVLAGSAECPEVYAYLPGLTRVGLRERKGSRKSSVGSNEDLEDRLGIRASGDKIPLGVTPEDSEHHHSQAETCGGEDERPTTHLHQNLPKEASLFRDHTGNNPLDQSDFPSAPTDRSAPILAEDNTAIDINPELDGRGLSREERYREPEAQEEMKRALKFSYFSTGIAVAGIIGIFSGYLGDQTGHAHTIHLKVCTFFMLATFVSGASMLFLTLLHLSSRISIKIFRSLKYTALGFLTLAIFDVSFLFLKIFAILAFVPALVIVVIAFFMAFCHNGLP